VLSRHVSQGQIYHVKQALPKPVRQMWDDAEAADPAKSVLVEEPSPVI
jgi:hypothetical protein